MSARHAMCSVLCSAVRSVLAMVNASSKRSGKHSWAFASVTLDSWAKHALKSVKDNKGTVCSGHGTCGKTDLNNNVNERGKCDCAEGWNGKACGSRVCKTETGLFNKATQQCTCAKGDVCCNAETYRLAGMMKTMLEKNKRAEAKKQMKH